MSIKLKNPIIRSPRELGAHIASSLSGTCPSYLGRHFPPTRAILRFSNRRRQLTAVRKELDQEYEPMAGLDAKPSKDGHPARKSSNSRTRPRARHRKNIANLESARKICYYGSCSVAR